MLSNLATIFIKICDSLKDIDTSEPTHRGKLRAANCYAIGGEFDFGLEASGSLQRYGYMNELIANANLISRSFSRALQHSNSLPPLPKRIRFSVKL